MEDKLYLSDDDDNFYMIDEGFAHIKITNILLEWFPENGYVPTGVVNEIIRAIKECA